MVFAGVQWTPSIMTVKAGLDKDENDYGLEVHRRGRIIEFDWSLPLEEERKEMKDNQTVNSQKSLLPDFANTLRDYRNPFMTFLMSNCLAFAGTPGVAGNID